MRTGNITDQDTQYGYPFIKMHIGNYAITPDLIAPGSFVFRAGSGNVVPGGVVSASMGVTIMNYNGEADEFPLSIGQQILIYTGYGATYDTATWDLFATVYICDISSTRYTYTLACFDAMHNGDKETWSYTQGDTKTMTEIFNEAAQAAGITVAQAPNGSDISVTFSASGDMTARQAMSYALQLCGQYAIMTPDGRVKAGWYDFTNPVKTYNDDTVFSESYTMNYGYTGVQLEGGSVIGAAPYIYTVSGNPFLTETNRSVAETKISTAMLNHTFNVGDIYAMSDSRIEPGDVLRIEITNPDETTTVKILPVSRLCLKANMQEEFACEMQTQDEMVDKRYTQDEINKDVIDKEGGSGGGGGNMYGIYHHHFVHHTLYVQPDFFTKVEDPLSNTFWTCVYRLERLPKAVRAVEEMRGDPIIGYMPSIIRTGPCTIPFILNVCNVYGRPMFYTPTPEEYPLMYPERFDHRGLTLDFFVRINTTGDTWDTQSGVFLRITTVQDPKTLLWSDPGTSRIRFLEIDYELMVEEGVFNVAYIDNNQNTAAYDWPIGGYSYARTTQDSYTATGPVEDWPQILNVQLDNGYRYPSV